MEIYYLTFNLFIYFFTKEDQVLLTGATVCLKQAGPYIPSDQ